MFVFKTGKVLPHDVDGQNNDILDKLKPVLRRAIEKKATIYLFGSKYNNLGSIHNVRGGIHNIHLNQGSLPRYENNIYRDGGFLLDFKEDQHQHWEGVFLAFASQRVPTDDQTGEPTEESQALADILPERPARSGA
jgi:uncharacterized protein YukJ